MTRTNKARKFVIKQKGQWPQLCADTGLGYEWLSKFARGKIKSPSSDRIEKLLTAEAVMLYEQSA